MGSSDKQHAFEQLELSCKGRARQQSMTHARKSCDVQSRPELLTVLRAGSCCVGTENANWFDKCMTDPALVTCAAVYSEMF